MMRRKELILLAGLLLGLVAFSVGANAQESVSGWTAEFGMEGTLLPNGALDAWADLGWDLLGIRFGSSTEAAFLPTFGLGETLSASYALDPVQFGLQLGLDVVPFTFDDLNLSAEAALIAIDGEDLTFSLDAGLRVRALPTFELTFSVDSDLAWWILDLWARADLDVLAIVLDVLLGAEAVVLDVSWEEAGLSAALGVEATLSPTFNAHVWFDVLFEAEIFELRSETDLDLAPLDLIEQRIEFSFTFDRLRLYAWAGFRGDLTALAGIGITYSLTPESDGT